METQLLISVIVPVYNGAGYLNRCLEALKASSYPRFEIIVVDDGSTDNSAEIAQRMGAKVVHMPRQSGPGAARNFGSKDARGEILFFVDSDVVVKGESIARVAEDFVEHPEIAAVFGSYDDDPAEKSLVSQYKNLQHHFVHQSANPDATTFWAGCGAIRREVFEKMGGFDASRYPRPSIEDIELGCRMRGSGYHILLDKQLQCKHLKRWTLVSLLRADIFYRALPWSMLILERKQVVNDLNLKTSDRLSAGLVLLILLVLALSFLRVELLLVDLLFLALLIYLNRKLYSFFANRRGGGFLCGAFLLHSLYFLYSSVTFALCWLRHALPLGKWEPGSASR